MNRDPNRRGKVDVSANDLVDDLFTKIIAKYKNDFCTVHRSTMQLYLRFTGEQAHICQELLLHRPLPYFVFDTSGFLRKDVRFELRYFVAQGDLFLILPPMLSSQLHFRIADILLLETKREWQTTGDNYATYWMETGFMQPYVHHKGGITTQRLIEEALVNVSTHSNVGFAPWLNMVQSEGTGKTRAIFNIGYEWQVPIYYVRGQSAKSMDDGEDPFMGRIEYPNQDSEIFQYLKCQHPGRIGPREGLARYYRCAAFLLGAVAQAAVFYRERDLEAPANTHDPAVRQRAYNRHWQAQLEKGFWNTTAIDKLAQELYEAGSGCYDYPMREDVLLSRALESTVAQETARCARETGRPAFIVVLDECRHLRGRNDDTDVLTHFGRAARILWKLGGVLVSVDSTSDIKAILPPKMYPSSITMSIEHKEKKVFTRLLNFDLHYQPARTVREMLSLPHIIRCGRPIWLSRLGGTGPTAETTVFFALEKLVDVPDIIYSLNRQVWTAVKSAAVVCARVAFTCNPYAPLSQMLVRSHLMHLDHYNTNDASVSGSYLCEPPVALAARAVWVHREHLCKVMSEVGKLTHTRELQLGERGVEAAQILLLIAADKIRTQHRTICSALVNTIRTIKHSTTGEYETRSSVGEGFSGSAGIHYRKARAHS